MNTDRKCLHGISFDAECVECEKIGLINKIAWMKPIVMKSEKRLKEIQVKQKSGQI